MTRTSKADANYYSISANTYQWFAGTPQVKQDDAPIKQLILAPEKPQDWDAILKISDSTHDLYLPPAGTGLCQVAQGRENAVDVNNRVQNVVVNGEFGWGGGEGDQVITVKGGSHDLRFWGIIYSAGRNADVVVGAWSDQSHDQSYALDFSGLVHVDDKPLTFILSRCHDVKLPPGAKVLRLKSWGYSIYWWAKFAAVKLGLIKGVK